MRPRRLESGGVLDPLEIAERIASSGRQRIALITSRRAPRFDPLLTWRFRPPVPHDFFCEYQQAVWQAVSLCRSLFPVEPWREGRLGWAQRLRQNHALPHGGWRRGARRRLRL